MTTRSIKAHLTNGFRAKKAKREDEADGAGSVDDPLRLLLGNADIWVGGIFPFVGDGHFAFVAGVNHAFKDWYQDYCSAQGKRAVDTSYSAVFSSVECLSFWLDIAQKDDQYWLFQQGTFVCDKAAKYGGLKVLKWAHENGFEWSERTSALAAKTGKKEVFEYAHEMGCPWNKVTFTYASLSGNLEVLKYAHEKGCPWPRDGYYTWALARRGHVEILAWLCENGGTWSSYACAHAAMNGHLEVLKFAHSNGLNMLPNMDTWKFSSLHMIMAAHGMKKHAMRLPKMDT